MQKKWLVLPLLGIMAFVASGFGCMGSPQATEAQSATGTSWWVIFIYLVMFALMVIAIPLFVSGLNRANRSINVMRRYGMDTTEIVSNRTKLIVFFVLTLVTAVINIIFFILLALTRSRIIAKSQGLPDDIQVEGYGNPNISPDANYYSSSADELAKYKALLDQGAITQEEYDEVKKKLLNI